VARSISGRADPMLARLLALAAEYDAKALELDTAEQKDAEPDAPPAPKSP